MKLNIAYPIQGTQKIFDVEEESKYRGFYDKRIAQEVPVDFLGEEWKGYIFKITGGNDKDGFAMKQGIMTNKRVRLLLKGGQKGFHAIRNGERRRKSVHGCIVDNSLSVLSCIIVKKGDKDIPGLTDVIIPRRLGPKRAGKIRKMFNLSKDDDVRKYVLRRTLKPKAQKEGDADKPVKVRTVAPKIQRLITPISKQRRRHLKSLIKQRREKSLKQAKEYKKVLASYRAQ